MRPGKAALGGRQRRVTFPLAHGKIKRLSNLWMSHPPQAMTPILSVCCGPRHPTLDLPIQSDKPCRWMDTSKTIAWALPSGNPPRPKAIGYPTTTHQIF